MANVAPQWEEIPEFVEMVDKLVSKYPERFSKIQSDWFVAYGCVNKDMPQNGSKPPYNIEGETEPKSFTNSKTYFVTVYQSDWDGRSDESKLAIVFAALCRLDPEDPSSGKVISYNYKDQDVMVRTFGPDWHLRGKLPNLLKEDVRIIEEPQLS